MKVRLYALLVLAVGATTLGQVPRPAPPYSPEQALRIREVVDQTRQEQAQLRGALVTAQHELAACYSRFELDGDRITTRQNEIIELQRQLLESHHKMQTGVRDIVGAKGFGPFVKRIENASEADRASLGHPSAGTPKPSVSP